MMSTRETLTMNCFRIFGRLRAAVANHLECAVDPLPTEWQFGRKERLIRPGGKGLSACNNCPASPGGSTDKQGALHYGSTRSA